jgi:hypothetical protein
LRAGREIGRFLVAAGLCPPRSYKSQFFAFTVAAFRLGRARFSAVCRRLAAWSLAKESNGLTLLLSPSAQADLIAAAAWLQSRANGTGIHSFGKTMLYA